MSDGQINFSKLSFFQKVEIAKENLAAQGKNTPSTADIVNEMVSLEKASKTDALPDGFQIERTMKKAPEKGTDSTKEVYGTPDVNVNLVKIAQMLERIVGDTSLSDQAKSEAIDILKEMVKLVTSSGTIPQGLIDIIDDMNIAEPTEPTQEVYGVPDVDPTGVDVPYEVYGTPDPKTDKLLDFVSKFMSSDVIPDDIKQALLDIMNNPENLGGAEQSVQSMLITILMKLHENQDLPADVLKEIVKIINELGDGKVVDVDNGNVELLYGTPDIDNRSKYVKFADFVSKILSSDLPDEIKNAIKDILNDPSSIGNGASSVEELVVNALKQLFTKATLSADDMQKLVDIVNSLGLENPVELNIDDIINLDIQVVYGTPDIKPWLNDKNVKFVLEFLTEFTASDKIPDDVKAKFQEIAKDYAIEIAGKDLLPTEILIGVLNKLISEMDLDQSVLDEISNILKNIDVDGADEIIFDDNVCLYDTPEIRNKRILIVMNIIEKLNAEDSDIPDNLKSELSQLLKDILETLKNDEKVPTGIDELINNQELVGSSANTKVFVDRGTNLTEKFPPDKFDILATISMSSEKMMVIVRKK